MARLDQQTEYWNSTGAGKTFTHPLEPSWLSGLAPSARILDYGCGYGRLAGEVHGHGFAEVEGVDLSPALIARARQQWPALGFSVISTPPTLPYPDESFDAVLLFAVLTCIPTDTGQREVVAELRRLLRPGGLLYLSDMCLQPDERNGARYEEFAAKYGVYGVFETGDGAVCRHHDPAWLHGLLSGFDRVAERQVPVETMNGHPAQVTQLLVRMRSRADHHVAEW
jgi:SAM-dependent methyltransferase